MSDTPPHPPPANDRPAADRPLEGRVVLVTGATGAIGGAIARTLAEAGANVAVASRTLHLSETLVRTLERDFPGSRCLPIELDVTKPPSVRNMAEKLLKRYHRIDIVVNAAGVMHMDQVLDAPVENFTETLATNVGGPFLVVSALVEEMIQRRSGLILNLAGVAGLKGAPFLAAYCASKAALVSLTQSWAEELDDCGVSVYALCPDLVDSPMVRGLLNVDGVPLLAPQAVAERVLVLATGAERPENGAILTLPGPGTLPAPA
ncbi:MAG: SDR family oxidoreductase [Nitrospirota bacterium]|nr:SDR family oxidoreductase [Nitrospirota bacterium]